jgi:two-component system chemotaxis sensor kinase CheA
MAISLDDFKDTYFDECAELLQAAEAQLSTLDPAAAEPDALNAIFRCVHSIKGGAGAFGFERLVLFATGLDNIRDVIPFPRWPGNCAF